MNHPHLVFRIDGRDERLVEEITLAGVIDGKIARGDYSEEYWCQYCFVLRHPRTLNLVCPHHPTRPNLGEHIWVYVSD